MIKDVPTNCVCGFGKWHFPHYDPERRWLRCMSCGRKHTKEDQSEKVEWKWVRVKVPLSG